MNLKKFSTLITPAPAPKPKAKPKRRKATATPAPEREPDTGLKYQPEHDPANWPKPAPRKALEYHVTGAIERGEAEPIVAVEATVDEYEPKLEYNSATPDVLAWAQANTSASRIEVIGPEPPVAGWVWLTYPGKPEADERTMLKANKFRWHSKRKQWYHRCGTYSKTRGRHQPESVYARMTVGEDEN